MIHVMQCIWYVFSSKLCAVYYKCLYNVCGKLHLLKRDYKLVIIFSKLWRDDSM